MNDIVALHLMFSYYRFNMIVSRDRFIYLEGHAAM